MNWKNVLILMQVDRKSGRLMRGIKLTRYRENKFFAYWPYWVALALGLAVAGLVDWGYYSLSAGNSNLHAQFQTGLLSLFLSLPTLVLIYSLVFTMLQQIQRGGVRFSTQAPYWLPITWQEHTLASILANLMGFPLASVVFIGAAITVISAFIGQVPTALLTLLAVCGAVFMASATTEVFRILQARFIGAVYKSTGRAAVWVRFVGSLIFFIVFYIAYFYVTSGFGGAFIQTVASAQSAAWFVPFVWLGLTLSYLINGLLLQSVAFLFLSVLFIVALFFLAALLNRRFGLYEPPAITVSRGVYVPKTGFLGRLGFSTVESALIRKDLRAFTRRRELMTAFIIPIIIILIPILQSLGQTNASVPSQASVYFIALTFLLPPCVMAVSLGSFMIGEEGQAIWQVYSSPISAGTLMKSKYFFIVFFSLVILAITGTLGFLVYHPSLRGVIVASLEAVLMVFALGSVSLSNGIRGADFTETPRARLMRPSWSLINLAICFSIGLVILAPFLPYVLSSTLAIFLPGSAGHALLDPFQALVASAIIAIILAVIFYRVALNNAKELIAKAEV